MTAPRIGLGIDDDVDLRGTRENPRTSYAVLMIDVDIPTNNPPQTDTLLHWLQTGLTPPVHPTMIVTGAGINMAYLLEADNSSGIAVAATPPAIAPYFGPNPPAREPLVHRYTQLLVDTTGLGEEGERVLRAAAATPRGFDAAAVLGEAGLADRVVAGNYFTVRNEGPVEGNGSGGADAGGGGEEAGEASGAPRGSAGSVVRAGFGFGGVVAVGVVVAGVVVLGL
jgi:hypothetical protein